MRTWRVIDVDSHRVVDEISVETWGEAIEIAFPVKCVEGGINAVWLNAKTGPDLRREPISEDGHRFLVIPAGREPLPDRLRRLAAMFEECADDIDQTDDLDEWRAARWARRAFDDISADFLTHANDLERIEDDELETTR